MNNIRQLLVSRGRAGAGLTTLALVLGMGVVTAAQAQAQDEGADPPTRVGRIAVLEGNVSFHASPQDPWTDAAVNYPVAQAGQLWVE
ncbi:MAG: hypothetical protein QOJ54_74, partial [Aliidongia sp.]|nr:hypothetical protein [Aliidongia sp.]